MPMTVMPDPRRRPPASCVRSTARSRGTGAPPAPKIVRLVGCSVPEKSQIGTTAGSKLRVTCPEGASAKQGRSEQRRTGMRKRRLLVGIIIYVQADENDGERGVRQ